MCNYMYHDYRKIKSSILPWFSNSPSQLVVDTCSLGILTGPIVPAKLNFANGGTPIGLNGLVKAEELQTLVLKFTAYCLC